MSTTRRRDQQPAGRRDQRQQTTSSSARRGRQEPEAPEILSAQELRQFDEVIPLVRDALSEFQIDARVKPGELQKRIIKAADDAAVEIQKDVNALTLALSDGILELQRSPDIGTGESKDKTLRDAMQLFVTSIRQRAEKLEEESQTFSVVKKRSEAVSRERDELDRALSAQRSAVTQLESDKQELTRQLEQRRDEVAQLRRENESLRSKEEGRERQILEQAERDKKDFEARLEGQLNQFEEDLRRARQEITEEEQKLRAAQAQVRQLTEERDAAVRSLENAGRELERAKQDFTREKQEADSAERDCRALEQRVQSLENRLEGAESERDRLRGRVQDLQAQISGDEEKLVRDSAEAAALQKRVDELTKELRELEAECGKSGDRVEELQDQLRERDRTLARLKEDDQREDQRLAELEQRDRQRREELARAREQLEDAQEDIRERARKPTPVPEEGKQWKYRVETLESCSVGRNQCPHPNRKLIKSAVYDDKTAPPSISLVIDTFDPDARKSIPTQSVTIGFKDETEKQNESPVAFTFSPTDNKPVLGTELRVKITPAARGQKTSIDFVGYDITMRLDKATFDPLFAAGQGKAPTISVVLQHDRKKVFRDSTSLIINRWAPVDAATARRAEQEQAQRQQQTSLAEEAARRQEERRTDTRQQTRQDQQQDRRTDTRQQTTQQQRTAEPTPVARQPPAGSVAFTTDASTAPLRVSEEQLTFSSKVPTFSGQPNRRLDTLALTLAEQSSPKRVVTAACGRSDGKIDLLDDSLFDLSDSLERGLRQGTTVNVTVLPYDGRRQDADRIVVKYDPDIGTFDPDTDNTLNITVRLCRASNVTKFKPTDAFYILTLEGQSARQGVFIEKVSPKQTATTARRQDTEVRSRSVSGGRREVTSGTAATSTRTTTTARPSSAASSAAGRPRRRTRIGTPIAINDGNL